VRRLFHKFVESLLSDSIGRLHFEVSLGDSVDVVVTGDRGTLTRLIQALSRETTFRRFAVDVGLIELQWSTADGGSHRLTPPCPTRTAGLQPGRGEAMNGQAEDQLPVSEPYRSPPNAVPPESGISIVVKKVRDKVVFVVRSVIEGFRFESPLAVQPTLVLTALSMLRNGRTLPYRRGPLARWWWKEGRGSRCCSQTEGEERWSWRSPRNI